MCKRQLVVKPPPFLPGLKAEVSQRHSDDGSWAVPGGRIEEGETPEAAARREVLEECGFDCLAPLTPYTLIDGCVTYIAEGGEQFEAVHG